MEAIASVRKFSGQKLRRARGRRKVEWLAVELDVSSYTIGRWEREDTTPDANMLAAIASLTGKPLSYFFVRGAA